MKNHAGIDLSDLSQAQRKMCVRLLALNNVQFSQQKDSYTATLRVPTNDVQAYLNNHKNTKMDGQVLQEISNKTKQYSDKNKSKGKHAQRISPVPSSKTIKTTQAGSKSMATLKTSKKPLFKSTKLPSIALMQKLHPQVGIYIYPKRLPLIILQQQMQWVYELCWNQRSTKIISQTQKNQQNSHANPKDYKSADVEAQYEFFVKTYYDLISTITKNQSHDQKGKLNITNNKSTHKNEQNMLNSLQTINHFQYKQVGVRTFLRFLSGKYTQQQLNYFLVLRALMQQFMGQHILSIKNKQINTEIAAQCINMNTLQAPSNATGQIRNSSVSFGISSNSSISAVTFNGNTSANKTGIKFKWNPYEKEISQHICISFLKVILPIPNEQNINKTFQKLIERMYYCQTKKGNYILFHELAQFLILAFGEQCAHYSITNLQLSYSQNNESHGNDNNYSTLNDIIALTACPVQQPLQTTFQMYLKPANQQCRKKLDFQEVSTTKQNKFSQLVDQQQMINYTNFLQLAIEKAKKMCNRLKIPQVNHKNICIKIQQCIQSIASMDKIKWVQSMGIQGNQKQLNFIQNVQIQYKNIFCIQKNEHNAISNKNKANKHSIQDRLALGNMLLRKIFAGPGIIRLFNSHVQF